MLQHHIEGPPWLSVKDKLAWQQRNDLSFDESELHLQYGYGAAQHFLQQPWDDRLEHQLQAIWPGDCGEPVLEQE